MCWDTPSKICKLCLAIMDECEHEVTFTNDRGYKECAFCEKELEKVEKDVCPYCGDEYRIIQECSQRCMSR